METLTHWLAEKSQIDFGNLAVGVGTMAVAVATYKNISRISKTELARARSEWVATIRNEMANFIQIYETIEDRVEAERPGDLSFREWSTESTENQLRYDEMKKSQYRIVLMLNADEKSHRVLMDTMTQLLAEGRKGDPERFIKVAQMVCKQEWETTKRHLQE